jgi:hypothetical protein
MCHSPLQHGLRQATHNTLGLGSWSTVSYLFRDRPATRTGPRLSATRRRGRWPLKPRGCTLHSLPTHTVCRCPQSKCIHHVQIRSLEMCVSNTDTAIIAGDKLCTALYKLAKLLKEAFFVSFISPTFLKHKRTLKLCTTANLSIKNF